MYIVWCHERLQTPNIQRNLDALLLPYLSSRIQFDYKTLLSELINGCLNEEQTLCRDLRLQVDSLIAWHKFYKIYGTTLITQRYNIFIGLFNYKTLYDASEVINKITEYLQQRWTLLLKNLNLSFLTGWNWAKYDPQAVILTLRLPKSIDSRVSTWQPQSNTCFALGQWHLNWS